MKSKAAIAVAALARPGAREPARTPPADGAVDSLRRHLAGGTAREHVVLDFLEDDLREARSALAGVAAWLANVERALGDGAASQESILSVALGGMPGERVEALASAVSSVRRRLAQVAVRM
jgi:hypothetical protein